MADIQHTEAAPTAEPVASEASGAHNAQPKGELPDAPKPSTEAVNGDQAATEAPTQTNGQVESQSKDVEMADAPATSDKADGSAEADASTAAGAADTTDTTADAAGGANKSKRKSTSGVPEHKTKKLNKKKSMPTMNLDLTPGDYVWARLKGYAPWPAICCDESMLPESLLGSRPVSTKRPDGTYREDFADGGKSVKDRTYPVMFFATNEFAWMPNTQLTKLDPSECADPGNKKLAVKLKEAYGIAAEGHDLDHFKELLRQHDEELRAYEQEQRELEEKKAAEAAEKAEKKAEKERRKSKAVDEMDVDGEGKPTKKRKKEAGSDGEGPKAKKTPKVKLTAKGSQGESTKKSKPKKKAEEVAPALTELTEEERLARREKAVFYLRHKLQRCFLTPNSPPNANEMDEMATHFSSLESHKDLEPSVIRKTKIHKVLKNIVRLDTIPREDEFNFKSRAADMLTHWNNALSGGADGDASVLETGATTNGEVKPEEDKSEEKAEQKTEKVEEKSEEPATSAAPTEPEKASESAAASAEASAPSDALAAGATDASMPDAPKEAPKDPVEPEKPAEAQPTATPAEAKAEE